MAISSAVNRLFASNGSVQSKATGACRERFPMTERAGAFNCLAACLHTGRNMFVVCDGRRAMESELKCQYSDFKKIFSLLSSENRTDTHWAMMASENPTLMNRGTEMLRKCGKQASSSLTAAIDGPRCLEPQRSGTRAAKHMKVRQCAAVCHSRSASAKTCVGRDLANPCTR